MLEDALRGEAKPRYGRAVIAPAMDSHHLVLHADPSQAPDGQDNFYLYAPAPTRREPDRATLQPRREEIITAADEPLTAYANSRSAGSSKPLPTLPADRCREPPDFGAQRRSVCSSPAFEAQ